MHQETKIQELQEEVQKTRVEITLLSITNKKVLRRDLKKKLANHLRLLREEKEKSN